MLEKNSSEEARLVFVPEGKPRCALAALHVQCARAAHSFRARGGVRAPACVLSGNSDAERKSASLDTFHVFFQ